MKESVGEDKTEKHFAVFLNIIYEKDADKDLFVNLSDKVITISSRLLKEHLLQYSSIEENRLSVLKAVERERASPPLSCRTFSTRTPWTVCGFSPGSLEPR